MNWYAVYTNPRAEKKAYAELISQAIEAYLPLQKILRQWSDRKKWVEEPLFRSYIFVNISQNRYFDVLNTAGIVRYITFEGKAVSIPQRQIDAIRYYLSETDMQTEHKEMPDLIPGTVVEIMRGALKGLSGQLIEHKGQKRVSIEIEALGQFLHLNVSLSDLKPVK